MNVGEPAGKRAVRIRITEGNDLELAAINKAGRIIVAIFKKTGQSYFEYKPEMIYSYQIDNNKARRASVGGRWDEFVACWSHSQTRVYVCRPSSVDVISLGKKKGVTVTSLGVQTGYLGNWFNSGAKVQAVESADVFTHTSMGEFVIMMKENGVLEIFSASTSSRIYSQLFEQPENMQIPVVEDRKKWNLYMQRRDLDSKESTAAYRCIISRETYFRELWRVSIRKEGADYVADLERLRDIEEPVSDDYSAFPSDIQDVAQKSPWELMEACFSGSRGSFAIIWRATDSLDPSSDQGK